MEARSSSDVEDHMLTSTANRPAHVRMTPKQWESVLDNPRQRNTERHLRKATHLLSPSETHKRVSMAVCLSTGKKWKLDGHTRCLLWKEKPDLAPLSLYVDCYYVQNEEEAAELYTHFDNQVAVETSIDKVSGAFREINWTPKSVFLLKGAITFALNIAEGFAQGFEGPPQNKNKIEIYELVKRWKTELVLFDICHPTYNKYNAQFMAAALLTIRKRGNKAVEFWTLYNNDAGSKVDDQMDGVEAVTRIFSSLKGSRKNVSDYSTVKRLVSAFEYWRRNKNYNVKSSGPKQMDLKTYIFKEPQEK